MSGDRLCAAPGRSPAITHNPNCRQPLDARRGSVRYVKIQIFQDLKRARQTFVLARFRARDIPDPDVDSKMYSKMNAI